MSSDSGDEVVNGLGVNEGRERMGAYGSSGGKAHLRHKYHTLQDRVRRCTEHTQSIQCTYMYVFSYIYKYIYVPIYIYTCHISTHRFSPLPSDAPLPPSLSLYVP